MRDKHGRYKDLKDILENGPEWAKGCDACKHGYVSAPELTGACTFHLERLVQAIDKQITFCTCQAGTCARSNLLNLRQKLIEEARKDPRMAAQAARLSHPDVEVARQAIEAAYAKMPMPTMHFQQERVTP